MFQVSAIVWALSPRHSSHKPQFAFPPSFVKENEQVWAVFFSLSLSLTLSRVQFITSFVQAHDTVTTRLSKEAEVEGEILAKAAESGPEASERVRLGCEARHLGSNARSLMRQAKEAKHMADEAERDAAAAEDVLARSAYVFSQRIKEKRSSEVAGLVEDEMAAQAPKQKKLRLE
jgi:hypothetical protein